MLAIYLNMVYNKNVSNKRKENEMKYYHYFRTNRKNKVYKCESILKFANWAEEHNIKNWVVTQKIYRDAIEIA